MHLLQHEEDRDEEGGETEDPLVDGREPEDQALHEEGEGDEQDEIEDHALDRVVRRGLDFRITPGFEAPGLSRHGNEGVVFPVRQVLLRLEQLDARLFVQLLDALVLHAEARELLEPYVIHDPHVPRALVGWIDDEAHIDRVALALGLFQKIQGHPRSVRRGPSGRNPAHWSAGT